MKFTKTKLTKFIKSLANNENFNVGVIIIVMTIIPVLSILAKADLQEYHYYDYEEEQRRDGVFAEFLYPVLHPAGHHQASDTEHHRAECQGFVAGGQEFSIIQIERAEKIFH